MHEASARFDEKTQKLALGLFNKMTPEQAHTLGNALIHLTLNKGKFVDKKSRPIKWTDSDVRGMDPGRHQGPTSGW
jgi:hypothetical protein